MTTSKSWRQKYLGLFDAPHELGEIQGHDVRLFSVRPVLDRPQTVGCSLHLLGGMAGLVETWEPGQLTIQLEYPGERDGTLTIYVPEGFVADMGAAKDNVLELPVQFTDSLKLHLKFKNQ